MLGSDWGSQLDLLMSPDTWEAMIRPGEQREYDLVHSYGKDVWVHSCGNIVKAIPSLIEMGLDVLNPVQPRARDMDPLSLKAEFGDEIAFLGGVDVQETMRGSVEGVKSEVRQRIEELGPGGGFVLAPSHNFGDDVPLENILAFFETAREYGLYPIAG